MDKRSTCVSRMGMGLSVVLCVFALSAISCRTVTNSRPGMQIKVNKYFDEEGHTYPNLDDSIFNMKMRVTGVLTPQKFIKEIGFWIFLTEPHDPNKIPVVFLHGHWTGPPALKELAQSIDLEKFEPWFTYFPTGLDIRELSEMFRLNLARLANYYEQDQVVVVAFSMGGLLAKTALSISDDGVEMPKIPIFIGIANPWGGSVKLTPGANSAITASPDVRLSYGPESWKQFKEEAEFIKKLFDTPFPEELNFHMIYGVGGNDEDLPGRDDGSLREGSLGRKEAVDQAKSVTVLENATHESIIADPDTFKRVNEILSNHPFE